MNEKEAIAADFNMFIQKSHINHPIQFGAEDIALTPKVVTTKDSIAFDVIGMSHLFLSNFFPQNPLTQYHHFTKMGAFVNIINTSKLYLSAVSKRFSQH